MEQRISYEPELYLLIEVKLHSLRSISALMTRNFENKIILRLEILPRRLARKLNLLAINVFAGNTICQKIEE